MNYRLQLSPISGTRESTGVPSRDQWDGSFTNWEDAKFFRSCLVYDSDSDQEPNRADGRSNWSMLLGLALAVVVSLSFWVGVGLLIARLGR